MIEQLAPNGNLSHTNPMTETPDQDPAPLPPRAATSMVLALGAASMVAATMLFGLFSFPAAEARLMQFTWLVIILFGTVIGFVLLHECTPNFRAETPLGRRWSKLIERAMHVAHVVAPLLALAAGFSSLVAAASEWFHDFLWDTILSIGAYLALLPGAVLTMEARLEQLAADPPP